MNKKMISIKKRLLNVCNRFINSTASPLVTKPTDNQPREEKKRTTTIKQKSIQQSKRTRKLNRKIMSSSIASSTLSSIDTRSRKIKSSSSSSSGYGTSIKSTQSVFMNLDNYFYDENFTKQKQDTEENTKQIKLDVIQHLLNYQIEFLNTLKTGLEQHIRPLSAVMSPKLYFEIFQNIEKIFTTTEFIRNSINESLLLTMDLYTSTLSVIHEYIQVIVNTYDFYLKGYAKSSSSITDKEFIDLLKVLNKSNFMIDFNLSEFIDLPIMNIAKIYCTFMSLLEMTPSIGNEHDFERLNNICQLIKQLIEPSLYSQHQSNESFNLSDDLDNFNSILENNLFKKKTQHVKSQLKQTKNCKQQHHHHNRSNKIYVNSPTVLTDFTDLDGKKYYFV